MVGRPGKMAAELHPRSGKLIGLTNSNRTAHRNQPIQEFNHGLVLSREPLRDRDVFTVRIDRKVNGRAAALSWGGREDKAITVESCEPPPERGGEEEEEEQREEAALPAPAVEEEACGAVSDPGTIMMSGCGILTNGKGTRREYCEFSLDELQEGDHIGLMRKVGGALHFCINGIDQGIAATQTPPTVYGVVDLYGMAVKVTIVHNHNHSDRLRRNNAIMRALSPDAGRGRGALQLGGDPDSDRLLFHLNCGQKAAIINEGRTALRPHATDDFNHGVVLSARPLRSNEVFQVRIDKMVDKWAGSIEIGVTTHNPAYLQLPSTMTNLRSVQGVVHRLHSNHGKNVMLQSEGCQAVRGGGYSHGIVFSIKELKSDELFESEGCQAVRGGGYSHGIVFSIKELKSDELFEAENAVSVHLGLFRLPQYSTDALVTFNDPVTINPLSSSAVSESGQDAVPPPWSLEEFRLLLQTLRLLNPDVFG
ncbi:UNVERIFIED_CONTAM: hypothetical protein FKN15_011752 [Acipenser sinensis]